MRAIKTVSSIFDRYSFDLIYCLPDQNIKQWEKQLKDALPMSNGHLSLYQLTLEKGTQFYKDSVIKKLWDTPDNDIAYDFYNLTNEIMAQYGLPMYEISNYAKPGYECQHNINYWNYKSYYGIGAGAHGRILTPNHKIATMMLHSPEAWLRKVQSDNVGLQHITTLSDSEIVTECLLMGLRTVYGVDMGSAPQKSDQ